MTVTVNPGANTAAIMEASGATYRQICYWCSHGWFGEHHRNLGSGRPRPEFAPTDIVVARVLSDLYQIIGGGRRRQLVGIDVAEQSPVLRHLIEAGFTRIAFDGTQFLPERHATCPYVLVARHTYSVTWDDEGHTAERVSTELLLPPGVVAS